MKTIGALILFGVLALVTTAAGGARGDGKPPFGVPDPARLVLLPTDLGGARITAQGYYGDKGFVSSYERDFHAPGIGTTKLTWLGSSVEVALIWSDAHDIVTAFHQVAARTSGQTALKRAFTGLHLPGVAISNVKILPPKPLTGTNGWDVEAVFTLNGQPAHGHVAFFSADRFLGELFAVGVGGRPLGRAAIAQLGRMQTRRFRRVPLPVNVSPPQITGTPAVDQTLTVSPGTWKNGPLRYRFQWSRCTGSSCNTIDGAAGTSYTVTAKDVGSSLRVGVLATNANGTRAVASNVVEVPGPPVNVVPPTLTGTARVGETLTAGSGTWNGAPTAYSFTWKRCDLTLTTCTVVGDELPAYTLGIDDAGWRILVVVTASNSAGQGTAVSAATSLVSPQ